MKHATPARYMTTKTVLLTFILSLVLFGTVLMAALMIKQSPAEDPTEVDASMGRVRTVALFFRKTVDELSGAVLLTVDTRQMAMICRGISPDTDIGGRSLQELYRVGSVHAATKLATAYGVACDGTLSFSVSNVAAFLVYAQDRLCLTLPEQMDILPTGENTLTPMQVADVLRYQGWENGTTTQADMHAAVVASIINRYWVDERNLEQDFKQLTALCDERLHISQFAAIKDEVYAVAKHNNGAIAKTESD